MDIQPAAFLEHLRDQGLAASSQRVYQAELTRLFQQLDEAGLAFESVQAGGLLHLVAAGGRAAVTRRRAQGVVGRFLAFAGHPAAVDFARLKRPKAPLPTPDCLSEAEERALRRTLAKRVDVRGQARDQALFCLLLDTGLRVAEAAALTVGDVDLCGRRVRIAAKGGKKRSRFVPGATRDFLAGTIAGRAAIEPLFSTAAGRALTDRQIRRRLDQWAERAGLARPVHPHLLRHTFATSLLRKTGNLRLVQLALDHESPKTTAIYAQVADTELEAAIEGRMV